MEFKKINDNLGGSFHNQTITTSVKKLTEKLGEPNWCDRNKNEKFQYEWEVGCGEYRFYVYDWKEYRLFGKTENIQFHIGSEGMLPNEILEEFKKFING